MFVVINEYYNEIISRKVSKEEPLFFNWSFF